MKKLSLMILLLVVSMTLFGSGVAIYNWETGAGLDITADKYDITIENQVAIITAEQTFTNNSSITREIEYAYPVPEGANATSLRFNVDDEWYEAEFAAVPDGGSSGGGGGDTLPYQLVDLLGGNPLYYEIEYQIEPEHTLIVQVTYVQLLEYAFGEVALDINRLHSFQDAPSTVDFELDIELISQRTITEIVDVDNILTDLIDEDFHYVGHVAYSVDFYEMNQDEKVFNFEYELSSEELGVFGFSTYLESEDVPDDWGRGFFTYIVEPAPSEELVMPKAFTMIVDRSGSMGGTKISQARNAIVYILQNLNDDDYFNIVDFASQSQSFSSQHVAATASNVNAAITYAQNIQATGGTNISSSFEMAIPQFNSLPDNYVNMIVFLTDGQATDGVTSTNGILQIIDNEASELSNPLNIFSIGIGYNSFSRQLLSLISSENNGISLFVPNTGLEELLVAFYQTIRNPVLLSPTIAFESDNGIDNVFPNPLPNLYIGNQVIVSGRYITPGECKMTLNGNAFGEDVTYNYDVALANEELPQYAFLTKVWAKQKIENLMIAYYNAEGTAEADAIEDLVIEISLNYGVISPFTEFNGDGVPIIDDSNGEVYEEIVSAPIQLLGNYPNPFNPETTISFSVNKNLNRNITVRIYNVKGQVVKVLGLHVSQAGNYSVVWHGDDMDNNACASGIYFYSIDWGEGSLTSKMVLMK